MVSVIIPCHNCENTINRAILSALHQTYTDIEIILINNNSNDGTAALLKHYQDMLPARVSVYGETKKGAPAARNLGLRKAQGEWIQFLDADDELLSNKIEHQLQIAETTGADVIAGECLLKYKSKNKAYDIVRYADSDVWRGLVTSNLGITSSNLWRRSQLEQVGGWDEGQSSSQEYDLLLRLLQNNAHVVADNDINTIVYFSDNSVSKSTNTERSKEVLNNRINLRQRMKEALRSSGKLTSSLLITIDTYIYSEIVHHRRYFPAYANSLLKKYKLQVKLREKLRLRTKLFFNNLSADFYSIIKL